MVADYAFDGTGLTQVTIKNNANIGANSIINSTKLKNIIIGDNVTINAGAFKNCGNIKSLEMGKNITITGAIFETSQVESATIESLSVIGKGALKNIGSGLQGNIVINEGITQISNDSFNGCSNITSVSIPSTVTEIGGGAFYNCTSLKNIKLPSALKTIGWRSILQLYWARNN